MDELEALLILTGMPLLGSIKIKMLIRHFGSAAQAIKAKSDDLISLPGFGPKIVHSWHNHLQNDHWKKDLAAAEQLQANLITYTDPNYPKRLLELPDHPLILYVKGSYSNQDQRCLAVVGTRHASLYGIEMAKKISCDLARAGFTIVSGFARGIDTAAHQGALEGGRTIAVLGSGLAHLYPAENAGLASLLVERGALISEYPMHAPPDRMHFPQRNRIVSGMTMGTILIEAPLRSGAMLTAGRALSQGRPLFVLPGRADLENFKGNHSLIKEKKAILIEDSQDVIRAFEELLPASSHFAPARKSIPLEKEEEELLRRLPCEELSIEDILRQTQFPIQKLHILLMSLVLKKAMKEYPGKIYKKLE